MKQTLKHSISPRRRLVVVVATGAGFPAVVAARLDDDFGARVVDGKWRLHALDAVNAVLRAACNRVVLDIMDTFCKHVLVRANVRIQLRWPRTTTDVLGQLPQLCDLVTVQVLEDVIEEIGLLELVSAVLDRLPRDKILGDLGPQLVAQTARTAHATLPSPVDGRHVVAMGTSVPGLLDVDVHPPGSSGHIDNRQVVVDTTLVATQVHLGAGVTGALDRAGLAPIAVAVAVATGAGGRHVVVGVRDGGDGGAVGVAALTEIEVIVGVLAGHLWPARLGRTGNS